MIEKPKISPDFTIEDIHRIREYNYEITKDMTMEEKLAYYNTPRTDALERLKRMREEQSEKVSEQHMNSTTKIIDAGFSYLVEKMGVIDAEKFIAAVKCDDFDYTLWQREHFDNMKPGEIMEEAVLHAKNHPHDGVGKHI